jgi:hypothetical protein
MSKEADGIDLLPGFKKVGAFSWNNGLYSLDGVGDSIPNKEGIYAFVQGGELKYIGAAKSLRSRLRRYLQRQKRGARRNRPVHGMLRDALAHGEIDVLAIAFHDSIGVLGNLPVHLVLGVEAGLIATLNPPWNRRGRRSSVELPRDIIPLEGLEEA